MIVVNGIKYSSPKSPVVVICIDGCNPEYLVKAEEAELIPTIRRFKEKGFFAIANSVIPSYTNPNNVAIVTGTTPKNTGIPGNWIFDEKKGKERALNSPSDLKCGTILEAFSNENVNTAIITAKDKLRLLLGKGMIGNNLSAELTHKLMIAGESIEVTIQRGRKAAKTDVISETDTWMYSGNASHYALELALELMKNKMFSTPDLMYISLTDYVPHRYTTVSEKANVFFQKIDSYIKKIDDLGCVVGITADHGMNDKHNPDGSPKVIWINEVLLQHGISEFRTILPITDKYSAHHGALGGLAWIHLREVDAAIEIFGELDGVEKAMKKEECARAFDLPSDIIGDVVLIGDKKTVFGSSKEEHKDIPYNLRSHGSLHEQRVPFILNRRLNSEYVKKSERGVRNYNIFEYALNGIIHY